MYLHGLGVIAADHGTPLFKPQEKLTRADLAYWIGSFLHLMGDDRHVKPEDLAKEAVKQGYVSSLQGNATYKDVNHAYFEGQLKVEQPDGELTREEFALFVAKNRTQNVNGKTLYDIAEYEPGPAGIVEAVSVQEAKGAEGSTGKIYSLKVNGNRFVLSAHPNVLHGAVDPFTWEGKRITESWLMKVDKGEQHIQLLTFAQNSTVSHSVKEQGTAGIQENHAVGVQADSKTASPLILAVVGIFFVCLVFLLFVKKKRRNE